MFKKIKYVKIIIVNGIMNWCLNVEPMVGKDDAFINYFVNESLSSTILMKMM